VGEVRSRLSHVFVRSNELLSFLAVPADEQRWLDRGAVGAAHRSVLQSFGALMSGRKTLLSSPPPVSLLQSQQSESMLQEMQALSSQLSQLAERMEELGGPRYASVFGGTDLASLQWRVELDDNASIYKAAISAPTGATSPTNALAEAEEAARAAVAASLESAGSALSSLAATFPGSGKAPSSRLPAGNSEFYTEVSDSDTSDSREVKAKDGEGDALVQRLERQRAARQEHKRQQRIQALRDEAARLKQAARAKARRQDSIAAASEAFSDAGARTAPVLATARAHMLRFEAMCARGESGAALRCLHQATATLQEARTVEHRAGVELAELEKLSRKLNGMHERVGRALQQQEDQRGARQPPPPTAAAASAPATLTPSVQQAAAAAGAVPGEAEGASARLEAWTRRAEASTAVKSLCADFGALSKHIQVRDNCGEAEADDIASSLIKHLQRNDMCGTEDTAPAFPAQVAAAAAHAAANELKSARVAHAAALAAAQRARDNFDKLERESNMLTGQHGARGVGNDTAARHGAPRRLQPLLPLLSIFKKAVFAVFPSEHAAFVSMDADRWHPSAAELLPPLLLLCRQACCLVASAASTVGTAPQQPQPRRPAESTRKSTLRAAAAVAVAAWGAALDGVARVGGWLWAGPATSLSASGRRRCGARQTRASCAGASKKWTPTKTASSARFATA